MFHHAQTWALLPFCIFQPAFPDHWLLFLFILNNIYPSPLITSLCRIWSMPYFVSLALQVKFVFLCIKSTMNIKRFYYWNIFKFYWFLDTLYDIQKKWNYPVSPITIKRTYKINKKRNLLKWTCGFKINLRNF